MMVSLAAAWFWAVSGSFFAWLAAMPVPGHAPASPWETVYLTCFVVGLLLSVLTCASGFLHVHVGHLHLPGHAHLKAGTQGGDLARINGFTLVAFLCWFGGTGYLLAHGHVLPWMVSLALSLFSGLAGGGLVLWFVAQVLLPRERVLEPADTPIVGVLGRVSATVPAQGVGEMLYSQGGARRSMPIAAEDGVSIARGAEVVVLRYARGVAFVRRWDEMQQILLGDAPAARNSSPEPDTSSD